MYRVHFRVFADTETKPQVKQAAQDTASKSAKIQSLVWLIPKSLVLTHYSILK